MYLSKALSGIGDGPVDRKTVPDTRLRSEVRYALLIPGAVLGFIPTQKQHGCSPRTKRVENPDAEFSALSCDRVEID
jgi:hypothetical protein